MIGGTHLFSTKTPASGEPLRRNMHLSPTASSKFTLLYFAVVQAPSGSARWEQPMNSVRD